MWHYPMTPPSSASASTADMALRTIALLDVPDCDCELKPLKLCVILGEGPEGKGCEEDCDCVRSWGEPCEHILALLATIPPPLLEADFDILVGLYEQSQLEEYRDLPLPSRAPSRVVRREAVLALYAQRAQAGKALFRDDDPWRRRPGERKQELRTGAVGEATRIVKDEETGEAVLDEAGNVVRREVLGKERNGRAAKKQRLVCGPPQQRGGPTK